MLADSRLVVSSEDLNDQLSFQQIRTGISPVIAYSPGRQVLFIDLY